MKFHSKIDIPQKCISKYRISAFAYDLLFLAMGTFSVLYANHKSQGPLVVILFAALVIFVFFRILLYSSKRGIYLINRLIEEVEIRENEVIFQTFKSTYLFNLFVFDPIRVIADKNKLEFALSELKYGFDLHQEYTKRIYIVRYELDEYLLAENFFEQFELIKTELDF